LEKDGFFDQRDPEFCAYLEAAAAVMMMMMLRLHVVVAFPAKICCYYSTSTIRLSLDSKAAHGRRITQFVSLGNLLYVRFELIQHTAYVYHNSNIIIMIDVITVIGTWRR